MTVSYSLGSDSQQTPPPKASHPGKIQHVDTGRGLQVRAIAYSPLAKRTGGGMPGDLCPTYDDPHEPNKQTSQLPDGTFTFQVNATFTTYRSQYCAGGFIPESRELNSNAPNARVLDDPIKMTPVR
jgi:hypothetical protein